GGHVAIWPPLLLRHSSITSKMGRRASCPYQRTRKLWLSPELIPITAEKVTLREQRTDRIPIGISTSRRSETAHDPDACTPLRDLPAWRPSVTSPMGQQERRFPEIAIRRAV